MATNLVISQARTGSTRLPDKVLLKILGKEILLHLIDRVLAAETVDHMIIATTDSPKDDVIIDLVDDYHRKVSVFRGSEEDVLDRYYQAALAVRDTFDEQLNIIRITSDCPLIDPKVIDLHVREFERRSVDYLSSRITKRTWPHGMELEIFTFASLKKAWQQATIASDREHVTPYIYMTANDQFNIYEFPYREDLSHYRLTIDYLEDYQLIKTIFEKLYPHHPHFDLNDIIKLLRDNPELSRINSERHNTKIL